MAKRKSSQQHDVAADGKPSKKCLAAQASQAKVKAITEAEELSQIDELVDTKISHQTESQRLRELAEAEDGDEVVGPGLKTWNTTSFLASAAQLDTMSQYDPDTSKFSHVVDVQYSDAFTLKPLTLTEGPFKGCRVLLLKPVKSFRFMELPPEIRTMVYAYLFEEPEDVGVCVIGKKVQPTFHGQCDDERRWVKNEEEWRFPSRLSILRVCRLIHKEAAPMAYSDRTFSFDNLTTLEKFLDCIGSMRTMLRSITICKYGYVHSDARAAFYRLRDITELRSIKLHHTDVCGDTSERWNGRASSEMFAADSKTMLRALNKAHKQARSGINVLDLVQLCGEKCRACKTSESDDQKARQCDRESLCRTKCEDIEEHCATATAKIRALMAEQLETKKMTKKKDTLLTAGVAQEEDVAEQA